MTADSDWPDQVPDWISDPSDDLRTGNHLVPVTYLRRFTDDGTKSGRLWMYDREDPDNPVHLPPRAVAKENNLYVWSEEVDLEPRDAMERVLQHVEQTFDPAWRWLVRGPRVGLYPKPPPLLWSQFCDFVAFQHARTPYSRDMYVRQGSLIATLQFRAELENLERAQDIIERRSGQRPSKEELRRFRDDLDAGKYEVGPTKSHWIGFFGSVALELAQLIEQMPMRVIRVPDQVELPTTDLPVAAAEITGDGYRLGGGFAQPDSEVTLALSPKHVFVTGPAAKDPSVGQARWCASLPERLTHHSRRFVYAPRKDPRIAEILHRTDPPRHVVEIGGEEYDLSGPIGPIVGKIMKSKSEILRFGPPRGA